MTNLAQDELEALSDDKHPQIRSKAPADLNPYPYTINKVDQGLSFSRQAPVELKNV